ncbi:S9 family peptidase [Luteolibacter ambystomatis]|uniref:prolyl oligopeptidase n=1 Tax=Luteolibacter ambystomatis TaxID=2824561 RepID=A0A975IYI6_9BACT|nr:prolyl oligopeptidase family serine peptidase [Luteolibacter ambystomatis]QUE50431.1 S9 family peptidase [Luteolibacter ambystomatis]
MKFPAPRSWICLLALSSPLHAAPAYPVAREVDVSDDYHGTRVADPYRWLEDDNSKETKAWAAAENKVTRAWLDANPRRETIRKRLRELWNYQRVGTPFRYGSKWFTYRNSGLQNHGVLYVSDSPEGEAKVLLDPNKLSKDGTVSVENESASTDGKLLAYAVSSAGSDWQEIRVRDTTTTKDLKDVVKWVKFSGISWAKDGSGFYYSRYDEPKKGAALTDKNEFQKLYFHKLGTPQSADPLVYERKDHPEWGIGGDVTEDGSYLIITSSEGTEEKTRVFYKDLSQPDAKVVDLLPEGDAEFSFIDNDGPVFLFKTDLNGPRGRVVAIDTREPGRDKWKEIIPESKDLLQGISTVGGVLTCHYLQDAKSALKTYDRQGKFLRDVALPGIGSIYGLEGRREHEETYYNFSGFTQPGAVYRLDPATGESTLWKQPKVGFNPDDYETKQVFYPSKDGTRVPMFIVHKKGLKLDGTNPTLLYGYGGFAISSPPDFSIPRIVWMEMGGIYAQANIRGGGEYGRDWHEASFKTKKQNGFDDFIGAGEWLIANKYTSSPKLAIQGGSNGGLLVGACMVQRPELFGAAIPQVGVMDMLRFPKFTIGWAWEAEYGDPQKPDDFKALFAYSPYHNLKPGTRYPATLVMTADHDDRVVPAHSFKFGARLQECQPEDGPPVLIRVESSAGHGAGTSLTKAIDQAADEWTFLSKTLGME